MLSVVFTVFKVTMLCYSYLNADSGGLLAVHYFLLAEPTLLFKREQYLI